MNEQINEYGRYVTRFDDLQACIDEFRKRGITAERAKWFYERESSYNWNSQWPLEERIQHCIARSRPDERLPPPKVYKPFGRTERERYMSCKQFILEADCHTDPELLASARQLYEQMRAKLLNHQPA